MEHRSRRLVPALVATAVAGLLVTAAGTARATTEAVAAEPAVSGVEVPGLTGAAAVRAGGSAVDRFRSLTRARINRLTSTSTAGAHPALTLDELHDAWGTYIDGTKSQGLTATHSVLTIKVRADEAVYAPTALPPGSSCAEITTAYVPSGPVVWAWDWCGGRDTVGKAVPIDSSFLATYTTTVNGLPAYTVREVQTSTGDNGWTVYLLNQTTKAWDTFYTTSGARDIPTVAWDFFEIYTTVESSTGAGYYCTDAKGKSFEMSSLQLLQNGTWVPADSTNSDLAAPVAGSTFDCPSLTFTKVHANDHWLAEIS